MAKKDRHPIGERPRLGSTRRVEDGHGQPREYHSPTSFDRPGRGRERRDVFSQPYNRWEDPRYVFYEGEGYHREFSDPYETGFDPEEGPTGGMGFQLVRERRLRGPFAGRGPKSYVRSEERILEDVSERLRDHGEIDATNVAVRVVDREVILEGTIEDRRMKRLAEDVAESVRGVADVHNRLRIVPRETAIDVDVQVRPATPARDS
jgi:BON domain